MARPVGCLPPPVLLPVLYTAGPADSDPGSGSIIVPFRWNSHPDRSILISGGLFGAEEAVPSAPSSD